MFSNFGGSRLLPFQSPEVHFSYNKGSGVFYSAKGPSPYRVVASLVPFLRFGDPVF